jgi:hypothetical protein
VERPFRSRPLRVGRRPLFVLSAAVMVLVIVFSGTAICTGGFNGRYPPKAVKVASFLGNHNAESLGGVCQTVDSSRSVTLDYNNECMKIVEGKKNYLLIGDSLAGSLWSGLSSSLPENHVLLASISSCEPFIHPEGTPSCKKEMGNIFQNYLQNHAVDGLLLEARWKPQDVAKLTETIDWAKRHQIPVIVFGPTLTYDAPLPRLLAYSIAWNRLDLASKHRVASGASIDAQMQSMSASKWHVSYISLYHAICNGEVCAEYADAAHEIPIMNDDVHLNRFGSDFVVRNLIDRGELRRVGLQL